MGFSVFQFANDVLMWVVLGVFAFATFLLAVYGLHMYVLLDLFLRQGRGVRSRQKEVIAAFHNDRPPTDWPRVTSQIPIYNESHVAKRVMRAVAAIDYPQDLHQIQVLDDSTDETGRIIDDEAARLREQGINVEVIRRSDRKDFKAGALAHGLLTATGTYVAVFDADFVPPADFLRKAVPLLEADPRLACIQGRWDHLNPNESWLTRAQALGIDGHFAIEQGARAWNGLMMNFNGTAGVWRREAIDDPNVGGWSGDTLTEDLDLSYRAQLTGWRLDYCFDLPCPAELPGTVSALKSQQRRWATGSIQVARKLLPRIWRSQRSLGCKLEATLHLTHYSVSLWMLLLALIARPMLLVYLEGHLAGSWLGPAWIVILIAAIGPSLAYAYARRILGGGWSGLRTIPWMLIIGCGLCVSNSLAVIRGLAVRGGEFVRTPKSGSEGATRRQSLYELRREHLWLAELALGIYSLFSFVVYFQSVHRVFSLFLLIYGLGFLVIGWCSRPQRRAASRAVAAPPQCSRVPAVEQVLGERTVTVPVAPPGEWGTSW